MRKVSIGFDLGVASVGWSVLDVESKDIIDYGVKLFSQSNSAVDRRNARALRRRYKRKNHRIERFVLLLNEYEIEFSNTTDNKLLNKRITALDAAISEQDLINILAFYLRVRGYYPVGEDTRENIYHNDELYPCQIQKIIMQENNYYRGTEFPFLISEMEKEINCIIDTQIKHSNILDENFKTKYMEIYKSRREFWEGPGGFKANQMTPFGRCKTTNDLITQQQNPHYKRFLYEELIKDCGVYREEKSVPVANYYAQRFNFLNDLLNVSINYADVENYSDYAAQFYFTDQKRTTLKLTLNAINEIESLILNSKTVSLKKIFKDVLGVDIANVNGLRVDSKNKPVITKFDAYKHVYYKLVENNSDNLKLVQNKHEWNKIAYDVTVMPKNTLVEKLLEDKIEQEIIDIIMQKVCYDKFEQRYHAFGEKALRKYIDLMEEHLVNSATVERKFAEAIGSDVMSHKVVNYFTSQKLEMSTKEIDDLVASPQVKKTLRKAITTFNQIHKMYSVEKGYKIEFVTIESTKELLSAKKVNEYINNMDGNTLKRKAAAKLYPNDETKILKHILLEETKHKCIYCDKALTVNNMEVEHIIPFSVSADDSYANKTASCRDCNDDKDNTSAYQFMQNKGDITAFIKKVESLKLSSEKQANLLNKADINKFEKKFINRNLRDTAYATKELMNQFKLYKLALHEQGHEETFKLVSMPPKITGIIRRDLPKNREEKFHHAFDASIAAYYPLTKLGAISVQLNNDQAAFWQADSYYGVLKNVNNLKISDNHFKTQLQNINYETTRFHREIKNNYNGQLANANIAKLVQDGNDHKKIEFVSSIYELDAKKCALHFGEKSTLCMKHNDQKTFKFLVAIYHEYKDLKFINASNEQVEVNPFVHYCLKQHNLQNVGDFKVKVHGIRPMNKVNRPIIQRVNYTKNVSMPYVFDKKSINKKNETKIMLDSLSIAYTKVYQDAKTNKFVFLPIYSVCLNLKTGKINENHSYYQTVKAKLIGDKNVVPYMSNGQELILRTNDYVKITKKDGTKYEGLIYGYHKNKGSVILKSGYMNKIQPAFTASDLAIEIVKVYGLGVKGLNIE